MLGIRTSVERMDRLLYPIIEQGMTWDIMIPLLYPSRPGVNVEETVQVPLHLCTQSQPTITPRDSSTQRKPLPTTPKANTNADQTLSPTSQNFFRPTSLAGGIKAAVAGVHGAGETLRGSFNAAVDRTTNEPEHVTARHNAVAMAGKNEIKSGQRHEVEQEKLSGLGKLSKKHYEGDGVVHNDNTIAEESVIDGGANAAGNGGGLFGKFRKRRGSHSGDPVSGTRLERVDEHNRML
jgi:hypothetical protein